MTRPKQGIPVYDKHGARLWESISEAARHFGCCQRTLYNYHLEDYADGVRLKSMPRPSLVGRSGWPDNRGRAPIAGPRGEQWESVSAAARALGCAIKTIYRNSKRTKAGWTLLRYPPRAAQQLEAPNEP